MSISIFNAGATCTIYFKQLVYLQLVIPLFVLLLLQPHVCSSSLLKDEGCINILYIEQCHVIFKSQASLEI